MHLWKREHGRVGARNFNDSAVIEVKTSHADFLVDRRKLCWSEEFGQRHYAAGRNRWYLCPEGVISRDELPDRWGLLYWDGKKVYPVVAPKDFEDTASADMDILTSILRRDGFPEKIFNYRGAPAMIVRKG